MKHYILLITTLAMTIIFTACAPVEDDIFTEACITLTATDEQVITQVQAQVLFTNVNTRQVTTIAGFQGNRVTAELLRGAYQIDIEGVAVCQESNGNMRARQFRCRSDYAELVEKNVNNITLNVIFLD